MFSFSRNTGIREKHLQTKGIQFSPHTTAKIFHLIPSQSFIQALRSTLKKRAKSRVLNPEYNKRCMTYCDIPPSRIITQSVCNVVAQAFGQVVHELRALYNENKTILRLVLSAILI